MNHYRINSRRNFLVRTRIEQKTLFGILPVISVLKLIVLPLINPMPPESIYGFLVIAWQQLNFTTFLVDDNWTILFFNCSLKTVITFGDGL